MKHGNGVYALYARAGVREVTRRKIVEAIDPQSAESSLGIILRDAIHHYGEELRKLSSLPDNSPEKLGIDNLYKTFKVAKSQLGSGQSKTVVGQLLLDLRKLEGFGDSRFFDNLVAKLTEVADAIPDEVPEAPDDGGGLEIPAEDPGDGEGDEAAAGGGSPFGDLTDGSEGDEDADSGGEDGDEDGEPGAGEVSEEEFSNLVRDLKSGSSR